MRFVLVLASILLAAAATAGELMPVKIVQSSGWQLDAAVERVLEVVGGGSVEVVSITGGVTNTEAAARAAPIVRIAVCDREGKEIYHWTVLPDAEQVDANSRTAFNARLEAPPADAAMISVQIAPPRRRKPS